MLLTDSHALPELRCSGTSRIGWSEPHRDLLLPPFGYPPWQSIRSGFCLVGAAQTGNKKPSLALRPVVTADPHVRWVTTVSACWLVFISMSRRTKVTDVAAGGAALVSSMPDNLPMSAGVMNREDVCGLVRSGVVAGIFVCPSCPRCVRIIECPLASNNPAQWWTTGEDHHAADLGGLTLEDFEGA
jgi:hypothetical protein